MRDREAEIERETHHPTRRKLLVCLAASAAMARGDDGALSKSVLAEQVFGRSDGSTRAMMTRMTAALIAVGVIEERLAGRERLVRLTREGHALIRRWEATQGPAKIRDAKTLAVNQDPETHPHDRPRFHLRHAAWLALASLRRRGISGPADEHYEQVLLGLIDEHSQPQQDLEAFYRLQRSWPGEDHRRILLAESIVRFQDPTVRRNSAQEFLLVGDLLAPDADAVLWASGAIDVAHHYLIEPRNYLDQVTARGLLHTAMKLMQRTSEDPSLAIASSYRLAKASKVAAGAWSWRRPDLPNREPRDEIEREIVKADQLAWRSAEFNGVLDELDRTLTKYVGPWIMSGLPKTEAFFGRTGGPGFTSEIAEWARSERKHLMELLPRRADASMRRHLESFLSKAEPYLKTSFKKVVKPHLDQARALLGDGPIPEQTDPHDTDPPPTYSTLMLNNLWTPEMVAVEAIVDRNEP